MNITQRSFVALWWFTIWQTMSSLRDCTPWNSHCNQRCRVCRVYRYLPNSHQLVCVHPCTSSQQLPTVPQLDWRDGRLPVYARMRADWSWLLGASATLMKDEWQLCELKRQTVWYNIWIYLIQISTEAPPTAVMLLPCLALWHLRFNDGSFEKDNDKAKDDRCSRNFPTKFGRFTDVDWTITCVQVSCK